MLHTSDTKDRTCVGAVKSAGGVSSKAPSGIASVQSTRGRRPAIRAVSTCTLSYRVLLLFRLISQCVRREVVHVLVIIYIRFQKMSVVICKC